MKQVPLWRAFLGLPDEVLGWWAVALSVSMFGLYWLFLQLDRWGVDRNGGDTFWSYPAHATLAILMLGCGVAGGAVAFASILWRRERSFLVFASLFLGAMALLFVIGEIQGH